MNVEPRIIALLLAAGRSRRMGAFKPFLPFGERTVIEACLENLRAAGLREIIVVVGHRADEVRAKLKDWRVDFAHNPGSEERDERIHRVRHRFDPRGS